MLLIDDYIIMIVVFFLRKKLEEFEHFKIYKEMVETETKSKIKCLRSDNGEEFTSKEFIDLCREHGIKRPLLVAREPQQNEVVEKNKIIIHEMAKTMLKHSKLKNIFWVQAVHKIIHIENP
jgi:transposase InsO family protein